MEKNNKYLVLTITAITIGFLVRYFYFIQLDGWFDEWNMFYTVDPSLTNIETWKRYFGDRGDGGYLPEYYPPINAFILKLFLYTFGNTVENARILSLIFGSGSLVIIYFLSKCFLNTKNSFIVTLLVSLNLFLIWQSSEIRPHSFVVFFSLLNILLFIKLLDKNFSITLTYLSYILSSILILSAWPFTLIIFFGKIIYLIQDFIVNKKKNIFINITIFSSLIIYILLNIDYLLYHLARDEHYTKLYLGFFYSYHFRSFFGSIFLGGIFLSLFAIMILTNLKNLFLINKKNNLILIIILSSYFLTIIYSIIGASVISPKYVIFILPLIILWIVIQTVESKIKYKNHLLLLLIFFSIINLVINFFNNPIDRPPTKKLLKIVANSKTNKIYTHESLVFNNFVKSHKIFKKNNLEIGRVSNLTLKDKNFWFLCLNNPRFAVGDNNFQDEKKCDFFNKKNNYLLKKEIKVIDYILRQYEKN